MLKTKNIFFILLSINSILFSQKVNYGIKAGSVKSDHIYFDSSKETEFSTTLITEFKSKSGMKMGLFLGINIISNFYITSEFNYTQKGNRRVSIDTRNNRILSNKSHPLYYFELPLFFSYRFKYSSIEFYPYAGLRLDYLEYYKYSVLSPHKYYNKWGNGYLYGLGVEIRNMLSSTFSFEVRKNEDYSYTYEALNFKMKNTSLEFILGITL